MPRLGKPTTTLRRTVVAGQSATDEEPERVSILRRRARSIFAPRRRRLRRALAIVGFIAASILMVGAFVWTVARLAPDPGTPTAPVDHDHSPTDIPSTP